jgi:hypothetical protein
LPDGDIEILDWMNLPKNTEIKYLGMALHDAEVESIISNFLHRSLVLKFVMPHLAHYYRFPSDQHFVLRFDGVQSARVFRYERYPDGFSFPMSWEQHDALTAELQAHWREESLSWRDFEASITRENEQIFDIFDAQLVSANNVSSLRISGYHNYCRYREVYLRAENITLDQVAGGPLDFEGLHKLSEGFWTAFKEGKLGLTDWVPPEA